ncbi:glycosyltransferase family 2 protein [Pseudoruegeria sp. SK021]|uniref:glycosyltransferase n=1 Tax=Pseudoruegeria sp. SK021 TaxID=1933035 RepID=UPI000A2543A1|nr:glycosyltransferase family 2 protein [Pseudoruegeria sp. SK021]OSP54372.1 hypothetical protein BV911_12890 [Pseudoruegeria sp. SK021]
MTQSTTNDTAIIIPARDEADRIAACLTALAGQMSGRVRVVLVVNNTVDDTGAVAQRVAAQHRIDLDLLTVDLPPDQGVGLARRIGCAHARRQMPGLRFLLTTDADCIVTPNWVVRNIAHLQSADLVCGRIDVIAQEAAILDKMDRVAATREGEYRRLVQQVFSRYAAGCADIDGTHGDAAGASLALRATCYDAVGGFEPIRCGEDRQIARACRASGYLVRHADDVVVHASCRLTGRAAGGMSEALTLRTTGTDYFIDDSLPEAERLIQYVASGTLPTWPPCVPGSDRVHVRGLPRNINLLKEFLGEGSSDRPKAQAV